jgi:hypothetical protein
VPVNYGRNRFTESVPVQQAVAAAASYAIVEGHRDVPLLGDARVQGPVGEEDFVENAGRGAEGASGGEDRVPQVADGGDGDGLEPISFISHGRSLQVKHNLGQQKLCIVRLCTYSILHSSIK